MSTLPVFASPTPAFASGWLSAALLPKESPQADFFQAIFESMMHGLLILNEKRQIVQANRRALLICRKLSDGSQLISERGFRIPESIWNVCHALLSSRQDFPDYEVIPEAEIELEETQLKVYAQWLGTGLEKGLGTGLEKGMGEAAPVRAYMLVTLEDRTEMLRNLARWDARRYGLTAREAEVWMLRCQHYSYDEIATQLYISRNTVKKHLKSIAVKRGSDLD